MPAVLLAAVRLPFVVACLFAGLACGPLLGCFGVQGRGRLISWWARLLLVSLGVRLRVTGWFSQLRPDVIVANHVSWLDVLVLAAARPAVFICKVEVAAWPVLGWLLRRAGTIFIHRGRLRGLLEANQAQRACLARGETVVFFPEGTTTDGSEVLGFRSGLFQPVAERRATLQPVALFYSSAAPQFVGETTFIASLWAVLGERGVCATAAFLPAIECAPRKQAAAAARSAILRGLREAGALSRGPKVAAARACCEPSIVPSFPRRCAPHP